ncbi:unnamed protein product [Linum tenue]|uniref:Uncharacterized protein n=1 Tax=Linum tenue TaxID=586396 RepID=A0AAV0IXE0_9ROSI|nr:unnamed protein product [Linum tenue]
MCHLVGINLAHICAFGFQECMTCSTISWAPGISRPFFFRTSTKHLARIFLSMCQRHSKCLDDGNMTLTVSTNPPALSLTIACGVIDPRMNCKCLKIHS